MLAMTGVITATTEKHSLITLLQDMEYVHGQLFERTVESGCGAVTCLPGALTMLRFSAFRRMAKYYFADKAEQCEDLFDYGKCHLGEDRWLTHLFMIGAKKRYQIQMCTSAFCKTESVQTFASLVKQRRRWFLGFITNEVCMITDLRIWKRYPILAVVRFMQHTIRTTALLFFIMFLSIITTTKAITDLPVGFIAISLGLNWVMMVYFGFKLKRYKIFLYPLMFILNPFFNWYYMVYGIFTAGQRTWGGPRADAGAADSSTTPQQAIEKAEQNGDDLNIVPETFKTKAEANKSIPLLPPDRVEGRFAAAPRLPGGWYQQVNDSMVTINGGGLFPPRIPLHPRASFDSINSIRSMGNTSVYMPRRVESIMGDEDRKKYALAQAAQRTAGGAYMQSNWTSASVTDLDDSRAQGQWSDSADESQPYSDVAPTDSNRGRRIQSSGPSSPEANSPATIDATGGNHKLRLPQNASRASRRTGRSPLGRTSLIRTADDLDVVAGEQDEQKRTTRRKS